jgi:DNA-binding transcriptional regulator YhcF (GntR family)
MTKAVDMRIVVANSGEPIYRQIERQIVRAVLSGELGDGDPLPSIRQLARELRVSVITTTKAYTELERHGFISTVPGKGCFARTPDPAHVREHLHGEVEAHLREAVAAARTAAMSAADLAALLERIVKEDRHG